MRRRARVLAAVLLAVASTGCARGCARRAATEEILQGGAPGGGGRGPSGSAVTGTSRDLDLGGTDCSDGLARCTRGTIEVSRLAHLPHPCAPVGVSPEQAGVACACPWDVVAQCPSACAVEGAVVGIGPDAAVTQLCLPREADRRVARPALPAEARSEVCADDGASCRDGLVSWCAGAGLPSRVAGVCLEGCALGVSSIDHGETATLDGWLSILCRRATAERR